MSANESYRSRLRRGSPSRSLRPPSVPSTPRSEVLLATVFASLFPELVDKPLVLIFDVVPTGHMVPHSEVLAVSVVVGVVLFCTTWTVSIMGSRSAEDTSRISPRLAFPSSVKDPPITITSICSNYSWKQIPTATLVPAFSPHIRVRYGHRVGCD